MVRRLRCLVHQIRQRETSFFIDLSLTLPVINSMCKGQGRGNWAIEQGAAGMIENWVIGHLLSISCSRCVIDLQVPVHVLCLKSVVVKPTSDYYVLMDGRTERSGICSHRHAQPQKQSKTAIIKAAKQQPGINRSRAVTVSLFIESLSSVQPSK